MNEDDPVSGYDLMQVALRQVLINQVLMLERIMKSRDNWTDAHREAVAESRSIIDEMEP